jgi:DNA-binding MarR family transcriptional regulator
MKDKTKLINDVREFNRFYTRLIGLLDGHLLDSNYSLAEARILYEIYTGKQISASQIVSTLNMDKGYVSRILKKFEKDGLINKENFSTDARISLLALSEKGLKVFHNLNRASNNQVDALISPLAITKQKELIMHMQEIMQILNGEQK